MHMPLDAQIGWGELFKRTLKETVADNCLGMAAQLAYYFFLSLYGKSEGEKVAGEHRHWLFRRRRHGGIGEIPEPDHAS